MGHCRTTMDPQSGPYKRAITELNREVSKLKESDNDQPGKVLSAEATVNEGAASSLTAEAGRSVRYKSEHDC